jgi:dTDP-4-dehydrorhamnose 3,5-epimerase
MPFIFNPTTFDGLVIVEPRVFADSRGFFIETYKESDFASAGIPWSFVQDNQSLSSRGTLRGLHFQRPPYTQGKLVRVTRGAVWDVVVDLRPSSPSFGYWHGLELSEHNHLMFLIPPGFAHGFLALEDDSELQYKCTAEYHGPSDDGIRWDSPALGITWPDIGMQPRVSTKDATLPFFDPHTDYFGALV